MQYGLLIATENYNLKLLQQYQPYRYMSRTDHIFEP